MRPKPFFQRANLRGVHCFRPIHSGLPYLASRPLPQHWIWSLNKLWPKQFFHGPEQLVNTMQWISGGSVLLCFIRPVLGSHGFKKNVFNEGFLKRRMALTADTVRIQVAWGMALVPLIHKGWIKELYGCCKSPVVNNKVSDIRIQMLVFNDSENGCMQGHFWNGCMHGSFQAPMRATRKAILTDARTGLLGNGRAQGMGQSQMRATYIPDAHNPSNLTGGLIFHLPHPRVNKTRYSLLHLQCNSISIPISISLVSFQSSK